MEVRELVERIKRKDDLAVDELKDKVEQEAEDIALKYVDNLEEARHIVADAFEKAMDHLDGLVDASTFESWFYAIVNKVAQREKKPEESFEIDDSNFDEVVDTMDTMHRRVALMYYRGGMNISDIADIFGCSEDEVRGYLKEVQAIFNTDAKIKTSFILGAVGASVLVLGTIGCFLAYKRRRRQ